jgi:hypothetical protein
MALIRILVPAAWKTASNEAVKFDPRSRIKKWPSSGTPQPLADTIQAMPYPVINTLSGAGYPRGALSYGKAAFLPNCPARRCSSCSRRSSGARRR